MGTLFKMLSLTLTKQNLDFFTLHLIHQLLVWFINTKRFLLLSQSLYLLLQNILTYIASVLTTLSQLLVRHVALLKGTQIMSHLVISQGPPIPFREKEIYPTHITFLFLVSFSFHLACRVPVARNIQRQNIPVENPVSRNMPLEFPCNGSPLRTSLVLSIFVRFCLQIRLSSQSF